MSFDASIKVDGIEEAFSSIALETDDIRKEFIKVLWDELIFSTPTDSGTARASWDIAKNFSSIKEIEYGIYGKPRRPAIPDGNVVIGSKLDYLPFLNAGWSTQAPALFIEQSVAIAYDEVK